MFVRMRGWLVPMALASVLLLACAGSGPGNVNNNNNANANTNANTNANDNTNVNSNDNTNTNTNGNVTATPGSPGQALVSGGNRMSSPNFSLILTTGEGPGGNGTASSPNYRFRGGLIGTTE